MSTPARTPRKLTPEQEAVASCEEGRIVRVQAFAGTGKTSTLEERAHRLGDRKALYVCFNTSVRAEAQMRFPKNVMCRTTHSLAFESHGGRFAHKLGNLNATSLWVNHYRRAGYAYSLARTVSQTLNNFLCSADREIGPRHLPADPKSATRGQSVNAGEVLRDVAEVWERMQNPDDDGVKMPHDGYLKLWALSRPKLPCREIYLDEAQDTAAVVAEVIFNQDHARIFAVGDRYQGIYGWRGAINAMAEIRPDVSFYLTQSFRFGPAVAEAANAVLRALGERNALQGTPALDSRVCSPIPPGASMPSPMTVLCRKNATVILRAIEAARREQTLEFVGGPDGYPFDDILDAYNLYEGTGKRPKGELVSPFRTYSELKEAGDRLGDPTLKRLTTFVEEEGDAVPELLDLVRTQTVTRRGDVVLSTGHKAKGLEWDYSEVEGDWPESMLQGSKLNEEFLTDREKRQELHLLYVASTRARKTLFASELLQNLQRLMQPGSPATVWAASVAAGLANPPLPTTRAAALRPTREAVYRPAPSAPAREGRRAFAA